MHAMECCKSVVFVIVFVKVKIMLAMDVANEMPGSLKIQEKVSKEK